MTEIFKNKYIKTISIVLAGLFLSNIFGYFVIGLILFGLGYYFFKKNNGGEIVPYDENKETKTNDFQSNLQDTIDKIKNLQNNRD